MLGSTHNNKPALQAKETSNHDDWRVNLFLDIFAYWRCVGKGIKLSRDYIGDYVFPTNYQKV